MEIVNLIDYNGWNIDILSENTITISSITNQSGDLLVDDNNNDISGSVVGCGKKDIVQMTANTNGGILLYNDEDDYFQFIDNIFTESDNEKFFLLTMYKNNKYRINSLKELSTSISGGDKIDMDLTSKSVFKVFLNSTEITSYTVSDTGVTITGDDVDYIKEYTNRAIVYTYSTSQTVSGTTTFKYYSPVNFYSDDINDYIDESFFSGMLKLCNFDNFSNNHSRAFINVDKAYATNQRQESINRTISMSLTYKEDLWKYVGVNFFRIVGWSTKLKRLIIFNNCLIQNGEDFQFQKLATNTYTYNIGIDDYVVLDFSGTPEFTNYTLFDRLAVNK